MKNVILVASMLFCLNSCTKNKPTIKSSEYLPMKVGNYWVYQNYNFDSNNEVYIDLQTDSVCISKDTIINGNKYFKFEYYSNTIKSIIFFRDSSRNLINTNGDIYFSEDNLTDTLLENYKIINSDTLCKTTYLMDNTPIEINTPSGIYYDILTYKGTIKPYPNWLTSNNSILYSFYYYKKGIGLVSEKLPNLSGVGYTESKLIRYNIIK